MQSKFILTSFVAILLLFTGCGDDGDGGGGVDPELNPEITSVSPQEGTPGTEVTISGSDFSATASENTVTFGGAEAEVTDASSSELVTVVPDDAQTGAVKVTVDGNTATGPSFTVLEGSTLAITSVEPDSAAVGTTVTIYGMDFSATPAENTVTFNGTEATVTAAAEDSLVTEVPEGATSGPIEVTVGGETATFDGFVVLDGENPPSGASTIAATIQNDPELSTLADLLDGTELQTTLEGTGPYTILAPTNAAFGGDVPSYVSNDAENILSYHVIEGTEADLQQDGNAIVTLQGDSVFVVNGQINNVASIEMPGIETSNGTIYKISNLLLPDIHSNVFLITFKRPITSKFACDCVSGDEGAGTDLRSVLTDPNADLTLFVPSTEAFANRDVSVDSLTADDLQDLMEYHIIDQSLTSNELTDGMVLDTRNGAQLTVSVAADGSISLSNGAGGEGANVIIKDLVGSNGVVYVIDNVLERPSSGS